MAQTIGRSLVAGVLSVTAATGASGAANLASQFPARILAAHNAVRTSTGIPPLAWDAGLAQSAAAYAMQLAITNSFRHSDSSARGAAGENLWMGTRGAYSYEAMVGSWTSERRFFVPGVFPSVSRSGKWQDVGHFTQMVWRTTTRIGCGLASNERADFLVCRYSPAGNVTGRPVLYSASTGMGIRAR